MKIYTSLNQLSFLQRQFSLKILFVAFSGIHVPLLGLGGYLLAISGFSAQLPVVLITLLFTLLGTAVTLLVLRKLLAPLDVSVAALNAYLTNRELPQLPVHYTDEVGQLMRQTQHLLVQLDESLRERENFASVLSHDIRGPINKAIGVFDLLQRESAEELTKTLAREMSDQLNAQLIFLSEVLHLMRSEEEVVTVDDLEPLQLPEVLRDVWNILESAAQIKGITLAEMQNNEMIFTSHRSFVRQILLNLLSNALKFSHREGVVQFAWKSVDDHLEISLSDQGIGFSPEQHSLLFKRFTKASREGTAGERSTGLGLFLARHLALKLGGDITAFSAGHGKGATFTLRLPR